MLEIRALTGGYGETRVLHGIDLAVRAGSVHALMGRNGTGKTTTLRTIAGLLPATSGEIRLNGTAIAGLPAQRIARLGLSLVPETRDVFGSLTVRENLALAGRLAGPDPRWTIDRVAELFPNLATRMEAGGHALSGGEQQMLAIGRALMTGARLLLLDEPTEGLAPIVVREIASRLTTLKSEGLTVLLVEQNLAFALSLADEISLMGRGRIAWHGSADALRADADARHRWLGV